MDLEEEVIALVEKSINELGYDLYSVRYNANTLSIIVDRVEPISIDDIVEVTEKISALLDEADLIESAYTLDVSSLGAEKPIALDKLSQYVGRYVNLHLSNPYQGENILEGELLSIEEGLLSIAVRVKAKTKTILIPVQDVDKARLAIKF